MPKMKDQVTQPQGPRYGFLVMAESLVLQTRQSYLLIYTDAIRDSQVQRLQMTQIVIITML